MVLRNERGQGSLEYLIIVAAVLAIAAVVVLFLSGAFTSTQASGNVAKCKNEASNCATSLIGAASGATCSAASCADCAGMGLTASSGYSTATAACQKGHPEVIIAP